MATARQHLVRRRVGERLPQPDWGPWGRWRAVYRPRGASGTPLYRVVQHHLETFLAQAAEADTRGEGVPSWVERDFRAYRECGILAYGFARARCEECGHERLIPFSCNGRGVCPSCNARRMCEVAAHLTDHVLPRLPVRQWVLSVPKRLRPYLHHDTGVAGAVLAIFLRAIRTALRDASLGASRRAKLGAVSFFHRFGSSLNAHPHYHVAPPFSYPYIVHMKRVTATDARKNWFRLLDEVAAGEVVCLERKGRRILITRDDQDSTSDRIPDYAEFLSVRSPEDADRWGWEWSREGDIEPTTREDNA